MEREEHLIVILHRHDAILHLEVISEGFTSSFSEAFEHTLLDTLFHLPLHFLVGILERLLIFPLGFLSEYLEALLAINEIFEELCSSSSLIKLEGKSPSKYLVGDRRRKGQT